MKKRTVRVVFMLLIAALLLTSCHRAERMSFFRYRESAFSAEVKGTLGGTPFTARLEVGADEGGSRPFSILFLESGGGALDGILLCGTCDGEGRARGNVRASLDGVVAEVSASAVASLLSPVTCLLSYSEYGSIQKEGDAYTLFFEDGVSLTLDRAGVPRKFSSKPLVWETVWWQ